MRIENVRRYKKDTRDACLEVLRVSFYNDVCWIL